MCGEIIRFPAADSEPANKVDMAGRVILFFTDYGKLRMMPDSWVDSFVDSWVDSWVDSFVGRGAQQMARFYFDRQVAPKGEDGGSPEAAGECIRVAGWGRVREGGREGGEGKIREKENASSRDSGLSQ